MFEGVLSVPKYPKVTKLSRNVHGHGIKTNFPLNIPLKNLKNLFNFYFNKANSSFCKKTKFGFELIFIYHSVFFYKRK